jgi:acyl carrier protein
MIEKNSDTVQNKVTSIIIEHLNLSTSPQDLIQAENFLEEFGINSVDALELLLKLENEFDIEIDDEDLNAELLKSIKTLSDYIMTKL